MLSLNFYSARVRSVADSMQFAGRNMRSFEYERFSNGLVHSFIARRQTLQTYFFSVCFVSAGVFFFPLRCNLITSDAQQSRAAARRCHHRSRQKHFIFMLRACFSYKLDTKVQMKLTNKCNAILITRRRLPHYLPPLLPS